MKNEAGGSVTTIGSGEKLVIAAGATLEVEDGATMTIGDALTSPNDIALADGHVLVGSAAGEAADVAMSGDVTIDNTGVMAIGAGKVTQAMQVAASHDGTSAKVAADDGVIGALPLLFRIAIAAGALATKNVLMTHKIRVVDAWVVLAGAGVALATLTVGNAGVAITDALDVSGVDKAVIRAGAIDDAHHEVAAGANLSITTATGATQPACIVYVLAERVA
jgi:hypothetical protein